MKDWTAAQNRDFSTNIATLLAASLHRTDYESEYHFTAEDLKESIQDIFNTLSRSLPSTIPQLPDYRKYKADGNLLDLKN